MEKNPFKKAVIAYIEKHPDVETVWFDDSSPETIQITIRPTAEMINKIYEYYDQGGI